MRKILIAVFCFTLSMYSMAAEAFTYDGVELEPLYFGQKIITGNNVQSIVIGTDGSETLNPNAPSTLTSLVHGQNGVFRLSGFDPALQLSASIADTVLTGPGGTTFDLGTFTFDPPINTVSQTPDANGNMTLKIGATLSTRASTSYSIVPYRGTYTLTIIINH